MNGLDGFIRIIYETIKNTIRFCRQNLMGCMKSKWTKGISKLCLFCRKEVEMKKIAAILTTALLVSACSTTAMASCHGYGGHHANASGCGWGSGYVDADGDGICDNRGTDGCGWGSGYVDTDGDGICDNAEYNIKYHLNGGTNNKKNPSCYYQTSKNIKLANPVKKGYTFKGWYSDSQCTKKMAVIKKGSVGKKTFYAKWKKN